VLFLGIMLPRGRGRVL